MPGDGRRSRPWPAISQTRPGLGAVQGQGGQSTDIGRGWHRVPLPDGCRKMVRSRESGDHPHEPHTSTDFHATTRRRGPILTACAVSCLCSSLSSSPSRRSFCCVESAGTAWRTIRAMLKAWVADHPVGSAALYLAAYIATVALSLPQAALLTVSGGFLFGVVLGCTLTVIGATIGATILVVVIRSAFAQTLDRHRHRIPQQVQTRLAHDGFSYLLAIRLVPLFPFWIVNLAGIVGGIRLAVFIPATLLGIIPVTLRAEFDRRRPRHRPRRGPHARPRRSCSRRTSCCRCLAWRCCRCCPRCCAAGRLPVPDFDLAVIGAGAAGLSVAAGAAQLGASVALIERAQMGGDCLNTGCVPSKALLAAAHAARAVRNAARFGVIAADPVIDWDRVRTHVQGVIADNRAGRFGGTLPRSGRHRAARGGAIHRSGDDLRRWARHHRPPLCHRRRQPGGGAADRGAGPDCLLDQRFPVRSDRKTGPSADPGRRPDRAGNGRRLLRPRLPGHRRRGGPHRREGRSGTGRRAASGPGRARRRFSASGPK